MVVVASLLLAATMGAGTAVAVPPPPPNPSDDQIGSSKADANAKATKVGQLTNQVAQAEDQLAQLQADVELKMEDANRALVDLQSAQDAAVQAKADADAAKVAADGASQDITDARKALDEFAAGSYKQGATIGSMVSAYLGSTGPENLLDRAGMLDAVGASQLDALDTMEMARTEKANKDSAARLALDVANQKQAAAMAAKDAADAASAAAEQAQNNQVATAQQLQAQKDAAEAQLTAAQANTTGLQSQRQQYLDWLAAKQAEEAAQNKPPPPGGGGGVAPPPASGGVQAVISRALSQLGVPYAWGGGNANGPTRGIHDGGVADMYGDYNKIGFDCSGLMIYAFAAAGKRLPHYSGYQATAGRRVPLSQKAPGDMLFWATRGKIHHVALYIGNNQMVEAPYSGSHVRIAQVRYGGIVGYATRLL
jgi:cell wall-associated NlpC family hydrolase